MDRLHVIHQSFQDYAKSSDKKYDLIVSSPPYFQDAYKPAEESKLKAKHGDLLCFAELVEGVKKLLADNGKFCLILPFWEGNEFIGIALRKGLFCHEIVRVKTKADKFEKRLMMSFNSKFGTMTETELIIL